MLTPTELHYLVGLLSSASHPEDVELELGSFVRDEVANEARDVDITIVQRAPGGGLRAFQGIEVKAHARPLDITHVEQLCAKLSDMPALTERFIVSGSGYTRPARRKAQGHAVELLRLEAFNPELMSTWDRRFAPDLEVHQRTLEWLPQANVHFEVDGSSDEAPAYDDALRVVSSDGKAVLDCPDLAQLKQNMLLTALNNLASEEKLLELADDTPHDLTYVLVLADSPQLVYRERRFTVIRAIVSGSVAWRTTIRRPQFMMLLRDSDQQPLIACAVAEMTGGNLIGLTISPTDPTPHVINISISDRNRQKIRQHRLR